MSAHAYSEAQLVEQPVIGLFAVAGIDPTGDWHGALYESLADLCCKCMFLLSFLFEWKTSE
jgi:hypothetical protein